MQNSDQAPLKAARLRPPRRTLSISSLALGIAIGAVLLQSPWIATPAVPSSGSPAVVLASNPRGPVDPAERIGNTVMPARPVKVEPISAITSTSSIFAPSLPEMGESVATAKGPEHFPAPVPSVERPAPQAATEAYAALPSNAAVATTRPATAGYVGRWATEKGACSPKSAKGLLPMVIDQKGARAGSATCRFAERRGVASPWDVVATCSSEGERWTAHVKLVVSGNRLTWTSERGSQSYVRC